MLLYSVEVRRRLGEGPTRLPWQAAGSSGAWGRGEMPMDAGGEPDGTGTGSDGEGGVDEVHPMAVATTMGLQARAQSTLGNRMGLAWARVQPLWLKRIGSASSRPSKKIQPPSVTLRHGEVTLRGDDALGYR